MKPTTMEIFNLFLESGLLNKMEITFEDLSTEAARYEAMRADPWNFKEFYTYQANKLVAYVSMIRLNLSKAWLMQQHCVLYQRQGLGLGVIEKLYNGVKDDPIEVAYMYGPFFHDNSGPAAIWKAAVEIINDESACSIADYRLSLDGKSMHLIENNKLHIEMLESCDLDCFSTLFTKPNGILPRTKISAVIVKHTPHVKESFKALFS